MSLNFVYLKYDVKFYTEKVQEADRERTLAYRSMRDRVAYLALYTAAGEVKEAARILQEIIALYGNASKMKMQERTTVLTNLVEDYEGKYAGQVATAGVGELVTALREAQAAYMDAFMKRNEADSKYALNAMADARKMMTEAYRDLVEIVNLAAKRDEEGLLTEFVNRMNNEIRKNFINTGQRPASSSSGSTGSGEDGESSDDEGVVNMKAATFIFKNGTELKLWFVPGEPIEAPANTEGYRWDPPIPEAMPKRSKTFREVAIEAREVTLTFHFLSHEDEELRGVVGTELTAPANTENCHWEPEVPSVFPEEDMTFNEVLNELASGEGGGSGSGSGGSGSTGSGSGSGGSGEQNLVTAKFTFISGEIEETRELSGTVIRVPSNTDCYAWSPDVPVKMPAENLCFIEIPEDAEPLYTVGWYKPNGKPLQWYDLPAGMTIPDAPACPEGYYWHPYPSVMPDHDLDIVPEPIKA